MDPLSLTASLIAILQLSGKVIATSSSYLHGVKDGRKDVRRIIEELSGLNQVLFRLEELAQGANSSGNVRLLNINNLFNSPNGPLHKCWADLRDLESKISTPASGIAGAIRALAWPLKERETQKTLDTIRAQKATCEFALVADNAALSAAVQNGVQEITKFLASNKLDKEYREVLRWLSTVDPRPSLLAAIEKCEPGTGNWFLEGKEFTEWVKKHNSFLWIHGIPGCGKTILSSAIINQAQRDCAQKLNLAVTYFYFDFRDKDKQTVRNFISTVTAQVCQQRGNVPHSIRALFDRCRTQQRLPTTEDLLGCLAAAAEGLQVFLILDALDECNERSALLVALARIAAGTLGNISTLATSRRERDIEMSLEPLLTECMYLQGSLVEADIKLFVGNRIAAAPSMSRWPVKLKADVEKRLVDGSQGMFRWAECQLDILLTCRTQPDVEMALAALPKTLEDIHERILLGIPERDRAKVRRALQFLAFSMEPLVVEEVAEASIIECGCTGLGARLFDPQHIVQMCSSLVSLDTDTSELRLAHYSVKEYLISESINGGPASFFGTSEASADWLITEICVSYLLLFDKADSLSTNSFLDFPFLRYASKHWFSHARSIPQAPTQGTLNELCARLLSSSENYPFINWLRVYEPGKPRRSFDPQKDPTSFHTPLYYAAYCGILGTLRLLLEQDASSETSRIEALHGAARKGNDTVVQLLLREKTNIEATDLNGQTVLHEAAAKKS